MSNTQTGIELYSRIDKPIDAIDRMGEWFAKSAMFGCDKIEQGKVLAMECLATNKPPSVIARTYHIMDGKLSKKALAALAEFRAAGGKHKWLKDGSDGKEAALELTLEGNTITSRFTIEDAKRLGVAFKSKAGNDTNWTKSPANMLRARCISNGVAMLAPEIFAGDVEDEAQPTQSAPLLPEKPQPTTTVTAAAPVIDVRAITPQGENITKPIEAEIVKETPAAAATESKVEIVVTPEAPAAPSQPFKAQAVNGRLTDETQRALVAHVGEENQEAFYKWLTTPQGKDKYVRLQPGQSLANLQPEAAQKILDATRTKVLSVINGVKP